MNAQNHVIQALEKAGATEHLNREKHLIGLAVTTPRGCGFALAAARKALADGVSRKPCKPPPIWSPP